MNESYAQSYDNLKIIRRQKHKIDERCWKKIIERTYLMKLEAGIERKICRNLTNFIVPFKNSQNYFVAFFIVFQSC